MLVLGALVAILATGVWLYCLVDIVLTSRSGCRHLPKAAWLAAVALTFVIGGAAWLLFGRPLAALPRSSPRTHGPTHGQAARREADQRAAHARSRHPAGRAWAIGPDDDPEFLRALDDKIRGGHDTGNDL